MINIKDVTFQYFGSERPILQNFSLKIEKNEFIGIIGPTGCGKSTICYLFNGLIPHVFKGLFDGDVLVNGLNTRKQKVANLSKTIGLMLQEPSYQIATPFVESEIAFGMENFGYSREKMEDQISQVIKTLGISYLRKRSTSQLSEGEKQRVVLASILAMEPEVLVLDECSSMIDVQSKNNLMNTLRYLHKEKKKTIILVEHDLDLLLPLVDRILLINNGKIQADASALKILKNSELLRKNQLKPPLLTSLFNGLKKKGFQLSSYPKNYDEAHEILCRWLT
ncbi:MAG: ABC transporter ATP-binding protein [Asgard group archaeon]|nr:ABC transporter ATP-binding protein [Asgard group archaeon]